MITPKKHRITRHPLLWFFLISWLLPAIACNYPGYRRNTSVISTAQLQETLTAQALSTVNGKSTDTSPQASPEGADPERTSVPYNQNQSTDASPVPPDGYVTYLAQSGDTLPVIALHFKLPAEQIASPYDLPDAGFLNPGQPLYLPVNPADFPNTALLFPDSEVIYSPSSLDFQISEFIQQAGGFLSGYSEIVNNKRLNASQIVELVARESSVNPRFLLAFLEFRSGWIYGQLRNTKDLDYPIGFTVPDRRGLYQELVMTATHLNSGYYGWRNGEQSTLRYTDGSTSAINPWLNSGSVAVQNLFAKFYRPTQWSDALYGAKNFTTLYNQMFGDPWQRASQIEPLLTPDIVLPILELPFQPGERWSFTGGPHFSWNAGSPRGAIDLAPVTGEPACSVSRAWVTASASGVIVRSANSVVVLDLDGDGREQTGWVLVYLHIAEQDRVQEGKMVSTGERLGHPSCERGASTGTHVHLARKYYGEWIEADGPLPFILSGWLVKAGTNNYQGEMIKGSDQVVANPSGTRTSIITR